MIPAPLVASAPTRTRRPPGSGFRIAGSVLVVLAICGGAVWFATLSPFSFSRWGLSEGAHSINVRQTGTYVIFEEYPGASDQRLQPFVDITVRSPGNRKTEVTRLIDGNGESAFTYRVPGHEGHAVASFEADRTGTYLVNVTGVPHDNVSPIDLETHTTIAVGRDTKMAWVGTIWGLLPLVVVPLGLGAGLLVIGARRRRRAPA